MTIALYAGPADERAQWTAALHKWAGRLKVPLTLHDSPETVAPEAVDVLVASPIGALEDFAPYAGARLIQSLWAGAEAYLSNPTFPAGPTLCRMVEPDMTNAMTDYICGHVLRRHLGIDQQVADSAACVWRPVTPPPSSERTVGVLGLGALGRDAAEKLRALRFDVAGWSRTQKHIGDMPCFAGPEGLAEILARSDFIVTILPATAETRHILNAETLAMTRAGAEIINPGRGSLIDETALLAALSSGRIGHATLDVFDVEPLPGDHPFWGHDRVTVTPHIAAATQVDGAARIVIEQIARLQDGAPLLHVVDRRAGY